MLLGVITALGFSLGIYFDAQLPVHADDDLPAISGNVYIEVEIISSLALRIHSNADLDEQTLEDEYGFIGYQPASAKGSTDPEAVNGPSLATGLQLNANQVDTSTLYSNVEVRSNSGRFKLEVQDADDDTALRDGNGSTTANEYIPAGVTLSQDGSISPLTAGWAIKGGEITAWTAITSSNDSPLTVRSAASNELSPLSYSSEITVNYAIASGVSQFSTYRDTVVYTATALDQNTTVVEPVLSREAPEVGDTKTLGEAEFTYFADGNWWTKTSLGTMTWTNAKSACPSGSRLPTKDEFEAILAAYNNSGSSLSEATTWSGSYWSSTPYEDTNAWGIFVNGSQTYMFHDYTGNEYASGSSLGVVCLAE